jgi:dynein heavy chain
MADGYKFSVSGLYHTISVDPEAPHKGYMDYIDSLPLNPDPEAFGMHANANITSDQNDTYEMFDLLLSLQVRTRHWLRVLCLALSALLWASHGALCG